MLAVHGAHDRVLDLEPVVDAGTVVAAQAPPRLRTPARR